MAEKLEAASGRAAKLPKDCPPMSPKGQTIYKKDLEAAWKAASAAEAELARVLRARDEREAGQREWAERLARGETEVVTAAAMAKVLGQRRERDDGPVEELLRTWLDAKGFEVYTRMLEERRAVELRLAREKAEAERGGGELVPGEVEKMLDGVMDELLVRFGKGGAR